MVRLSHSGQGDGVARLVRRARWRRNVLELQRALYLVVAIVAGGTALLLLAALRAGLLGFTLVAVGVAAAALSGVVFAGRRLHRAWLRPGAAALWADDRAGLEGRLATLVELRARGADPERTFFLPLLTAQIEERSDTLAPERLTPETVPPGALGAALAAITACLLLFAVAPLLAPRMPQIDLRNGPLRLARVAGLPRDADRVTTTPWSARVDGGEPSTGRGAAAPGGDGGSSSLLERLAAGVQEQIRAGLWGQEWDRIRDALARAERQRAARQRDEEHATRDEPGEGWERARAEAAGNGTAVEDARGDDETGRRAAAGAVEHDGGGEAGPGAGTDTDPNLFGAASASADGSGETFDLAIVARVRAHRAAARPPTGPAPAAAPDNRPGLATRQRPEAAIPKVVVPPAYEALLHDIYARQTAPAGPP